MYLNFFILFYFTNQLKLVTYKLIWIYYSFETVRKCGRYMK